MSRRPRRGRTQAGCANIPYVRPLRGRSYHHSLNRRLRCLRQLNQRLWIFAAFLLWQATKSSAATLSRDDNQLKMCLLCTCESSAFFFLLFLLASVLSLSYLFLNFSPSFFAMKAAKITTSSVFVARAPKPRWPLAMTMSQKKTTATRV